MLAPHVKRARIMGTATRQKGPIAPNKSSEKQHVFSKKCQKFLPAAGAPSQRCLVLQNRII